MGTRRNSKHTRRPWPTVHPRMCTISYIRTETNSFPASSRKLHNAVKSASRKKSGPVNVTIAKMAIVTSNAIRCLAARPNFALGSKTKQPPIQILRRLGWLHRSTSLSSRLAMCLSPVRRIIQNVAKAQPILIYRRSTGPRRETRKTDFMRNFSPRRVFPRTRSN